MSGSTTASSSNEVLPRESEGDISMFVDLESPSQDSPTSSNASTTTKRQETSSRGGIRVSLACLPCRSRHVKCGAEVPVCSRCQQDDKPCYYAKSRRGMRDGPNPRKKDSIQHGGKDNRISDTRYIHHDAIGFPIGRPSTEMYTGTSVSCPGSLESSVSRSGSTGRLIDLFYMFFYKIHPFVLPRYYFFSRLDSDPDSVNHLRVAMEYVGSLYDPDISTNEQRDLALEQLEIATLHPTGFTVQALLLTANALDLEDRTDLSRTVLDTAIYLALELRMNIQEFASLEPDQVLAESWRRTYWGLCSMDSTFGGSTTRAPSLFPG
ncbi:uncharacterized protein BP5553_08666 [Venustampulla echinocandica]|uniref:Zn(2)-C6 fungal-type domain-containing protein n=1 Tax=Venustampulla echinocandica TaxID=2656787 RepID=A0A370TEV9_9HELO|nr:uncharacterized protein BP5553_08666 [Venustampulla echinocandica]RDL33227.1 hypothetical protein BP5553_08666 [Venustampulla echinocandica]